MDEVLPMFIGWMSFSGEDNLNRLPPVEQGRFDAAQIMEDHGCPLVSRKPARKTDCKRIRIQQRSHRNHLTRIDAVFGPARPGTLSSKGEEFPLQEEMHIPEFLVGNIHHPIPKR